MFENFTLSAKEAQQLWEELCSPSLKTIKCRTTFLESLNNIHVKKNANGDFSVDILDLELDLDSLFAPSDFNVEDAGSYKLISENPKTKQKAEFGKLIYTTISKLTNETSTSKTLTQLTSNHCADYSIQRDGKNLELSLAS